MCFLLKGIVQNTKGDVNLTSINGLCIDCGCLCHVEHSITSSDGSETTDYDDLVFEMSDTGVLYSVMNFSVHDVVDMMVEMMELSDLDELNEYWNSSD